MEWLESGVNISMRVVLATLYMDQLVVCTRLMDWYREQDTAAHLTVVFF